MFSRTVALLVRSLRVDARLMRTHLFRLLFVGFICVNLAWAQALSVAMGAPGLQFFMQIAYLNFVFISLAGVSFFATAITEEKEEDTLGLLKMAGVSSLAILLGKSTSRLLSAVLLLLVQLPFTLLAITLGGVTMLQILAAYFSLGAYMVFLANAGLLSSVICSRSRRACSLMVLFLIALLPGPWIGTSILDAGVQTGRWSSANFLVAGGQALCGFLQEATVLHRITSIMFTGFDDSLLGTQVVSNLIAAALLFFMAWAVFERCTRDLASSTSPVRGLVFKGAGLRRFLARGGVWSDALVWFLGGGRVWRQALIWKDFHFVAGGPVMLAAKFLLYGTIVACLGYLNSSEGALRFAENLGGQTMAAAITVLAIEMSIYASRIFHEEMKWKTLSTMMMLPLSTITIAWSKVAGCTLGLIPGVCCFFVGYWIHPSGGHEVGDALSEMGTWFSFLYFIAFLHIVAFLSLILKWGALPLGIATTLMLTWCGWLAIVIVMIATSFGRMPEGIETILFTFLDAVVVAVIVMLQAGIGWRLKAVGAQ